MKAGRHDGEELDGIARLLGMEVSCVVHKFRASSDLFIDGEGETTSQGEATTCVEHENVQIRINRSDSPNIREKKLDSTHLQCARVVTRWVGEEEERVSRCHYRNA